MYMIVCLTGLSLGFCKQQHSLGCRATYTCSPLIGS